MDVSDPGRYAEVNGLRMYYEIHGEGPALLMLHGGTCSIERPPMSIPFFSGAFTVIAPEQMGHGRTDDDTDRAFHYHEMAEDTVELLRQLEIDRGSVIDLSDGGIVGIDMAILDAQLCILPDTGQRFRKTPSSPS